MNKFKTPYPPENWEDKYRKYIEDRHIEDFAEYFDKSDYIWEILQNCWLQNYHILIAYAPLKESESFIYCREKIIGLVKFSFDNTILDSPKATMLHCYNKKHASGNVYPYIISAGYNQIDKDPFQKWDNIIHILPLLIQRGCGTFKNKNKVTYNMFDDANDMAVHRLIAGCQYYIKGKHIHHLDDELRDTIWFNSKANLLPLDNSTHTKVTNGYKLDYKEIEDIRLDLSNEVRIKEATPSGMCNNYYTYWQILYLHYILKIDDKTIKSYFGSRLSIRSFYNIKKHCLHHFPCFESFFSTLSLE